MNDKFGLVCRLQKEISLIMGNHLTTVINEIFKFPPYLGTFSQINYLMKSLQATRIIQLKNDTFGLVSRLPFFIGIINFQYRLLLKLKLPY